MLTQTKKNTYETRTMYTLLSWLLNAYTQTVSRILETEISPLPIFFLKNKSLSMNIGIVVYCELSWNYVVDSAHTGKAESSCYLCKL